VLDIPPRSLLRQKLTCHFRQSELLIQLAVRQQSGVGGDLAARKLEPNPSVELQAQWLLLPFTHRVPPAIIAATLAVTPA
jgi:hypothetical protein